MISIEFKNIDKLKRNIIAHPRKSFDEIQEYLTKAQIVIERIYTKNPWRVGGTGGGVPIKTGNLLKKGTGLEIKTMSRGFYVDDAKVDYAEEVYEGRKNMKGRPWLHYAGEKGEKDIEKLQVKLLNNIVENIIK